MIQRIQTLYLLCVALLMGVLLFVPLAWFGSSVGEFELYAFVLKTNAGEVVQSSVYLGILLMLACLLPLVTIFLYKRRMLQLRLCVIEMVLLVGVIAVEVVYYFLCSRVFADEVFHAQGIKFVVVFPVVCLLPVFLAARAIFRDELLVRSLNRIR